MMMVYLYFAIYDKYNTITFLGPLNRLIMICNYQSGATTSNDIKLSYYIPTYGPNSAGWEKSAWNVLTLPALQESPSPNGWSGKLVLLDSWQSIVGEYLAEFSLSWDARKRVQERVDISWNSRKSEFVKLLYNPNECKWGIFRCPTSYCYIK